jgi:hypothetical protein
VDFTSPFAFALYQKKELAARVGKTSRRFTGITDLGCTSTDQDSDRREADNIIEALLYWLALS